MGLAPTGKRRLVTAHTRNVISLTVNYRTANGSLDQLVGDRGQGRRNSETGIGVLVEIERAADGWGKPLP